MTTEQVKGAHDGRGGSLAADVVATLLAGRTLVEIAEAERLPQAEPACCDAVLAGTDLAALAEPDRTLRDWFDLLKPAGRLVLYTAAPSDTAEAPPDRPVLSPGGMVDMVAAALDPTAYRIIHLAPAGALGGRAAGTGTTAPATDPARGLVLVVEKAEAPPPAGKAAGKASAAAPERLAAEAPAEPAPGMHAEGRLLVRDFAPPVSGRLHILLFKLDHFGDFVIGLPAMQALRRNHPDAYIRCVCGRWNAGNAEASGLFDDVRTYDFFPERAEGWNGRPVQGWDVFAAATEGHFDIAVDLRVDADTRPLLARVDARLRCGIGSQVRFPMLDVAFPGEQLARSGENETNLATRLLTPDRFTTRLAERTPFMQEGHFDPTNVHVVFGPYQTLPVGRFAAWFGLRTHNFVPGPRKVSTTVDVMRDGRDLLASRRFFHAQMWRLDGMVGPLEFANDSETAQYEFRVFCGGRPLAGSLRFTGVYLQHLDAPVLARFRPAELHVGEQLSLLVDLIRQRTSDPYEALAPRPVPASPEIASLLDVPPGTRRIMLAPVSNSSLRDWPMAHYAELVALLLRRLDCRVFLLGSPPQAEAMAPLRAADPDRVVSLAGRTRWSDLGAVLDAADLVICNNSGVAHQAASRGRPTLAIYSASHQPQQWGPRGARSRALMLPLPCSPCGYDQLALCPNEHACMRGISPAEVLEQAARMLSPASPVASPERLSA
ncbi:glycosyltransferase family 9 protein [Roseomonas sp. NAR14]|uniref:Glycosyltransferase family 9 protein n=1 Tax=Roseomonas acroporae TaxID=2937791 RepID=A0A9X1YIG7_9PROT|nr:glycosyltransferase family 9 protein [Roseomonas acroporae]MCK8786796.1 glycosyltransferase family 9 protein [Roseomonas acroporae]